MRVIADGKGLPVLGYNYGSAHMQTSPPKYPKNPRLTNFQILSDPAQYDWTHPRCVDRNDPNVWYGKRSNEVRKSTNRGLNWTTIYTFPAGYQIAHIIHLKNGSLVVSMLEVSTANEVWVSDPTQTTWTNKITLTPQATVSPQYGWDTYENIVLLSEYGAHNAVNTPKHVYLSIDYGVTWNIIFTRENNATSKHQHDTVFDPWCGRIWSSYGDSYNSNIQYSDDWGATWTKVFQVEGVAQSTTIIPRPHCVIFLADEEPDGVYRWLRDPHDPRPVVDPADIHRVFKLKAIAGEWKLGHVGEKGNEINGVLYMPIVSYLSLGWSSLIVSPDDEHFYEVYRPVEQEGVIGIHSIIGIDGNGKLRGTYAYSNGTINVFTCDPVEWLPEEKPKKSKTVKTHDAVSIAAGVSNTSRWFSCDGYDEIGITVKNDTTKSTKATLFWSHDGVNIHGARWDILPSSTIAEREVSLRVSAPFAQLRVTNEDTAAHVISAWLYMKP